MATLTEILLEQPDFEVTFPFVQCAECEEVWDVASATAAGILLRRAVVMEGGIASQTIAWCPEHTSEAWLPIPQDVDTLADTVWYRATGLALSDEQPLVQAIVRGQSQAAIAVAQAFCDVE